MDAFNDDWVFVATNATAARIPSLRQGLGSRTHDDDSQDDLSENPCTYLIGEVPPNYRP